MAEAIFEMKTYTACKIRHKHSNKTHPADWRAKMIVQEYARKLRTLDWVFVMDVVGDGTNHTVGPFGIAQERFYRGQIIPLCTGGFGEINKDFEKIITLLVWEAASGDAGLTISPLVNTNRKGGAFQIMMQQFKRAIKVAIFSGNAKHKRGRLHYVRERYNSGVRSQLG